MFKKYVNDLRRLAFTGIPPNELSNSPDVVHNALNGGPAVELEKTDSRHDRRSAGAFFTPNIEASRMIARFPPSNRTFAYIDPSCGVGDLLLAAAQTLPVRHTLEDTLQLWSKLLAGFDLDDRFVSATKARLILLARSRLHDTWDTPFSTHKELFPHILVADGLHHELPPIAPSIRMLMNPPFTRIRAPDGCSWSSGSVSAAAVFIDHWTQTLPQGSQIVAILPDALRSGSRYERWRHAIEAQTRLLSLESRMRFSPTIDIDVFLLAVTVDPPEHETSYPWWPHPTGSTTVRDLFDVRVGTVVPHRHDKTGPLRKYATTQSLPIGRDVATISSVRRFAGTVFKGPFLTVRRTSRPGGPRCAVTLVSTTDPVAVENHLVVLLPKDGTVATCRTAMQQITRRTTDRWLDSRIRCRHLTVSAVESIPLDQEDE